MKQSEFKRWLARMGARFEEGANHTKVMLNGKISFLPRHPSTEMKKGLVEAIKKQLNLK
ncbi:MAG: type II toxin-antitoxin system HicA family toxin [Betaproteobacteria bacterium]|nr:type II toxin-antitoxin system HicA family toxin [Betaproteobacteria bacterium]